MRLFIAPRTGTGTRTDPFRPRVPRGERVGAYELPDGRFLCVAPNVDATPADVTDLGGTVEGRLSGTRQDDVADALGLVRGDVADLTVGEAIVAAEGARLRPGRTRTKVRIAGVDLYDAPAIRGGATDTFTYSNGSLSTVSSGAWAAMKNDVVVASNQASLDSNQERRARWATAFSGDHYSQFDYSFTGSANIAALTRCSAVADSCFYGHVQDDGVAELYRVDAGSFVGPLDTNSGIATTGTLRGESEGSVQTFLRNGVEILSATDSTHNALNYVGIGGFGHTALGDNWEGGALAGDATATLIVILTTTTLPQVTVSGSVAATMFRGLTRSTSVLG